MSAATRHFAVNVVFLTALLSSVAAHSQNGRVTIELIGIKSDSGTVAIAMWNDEEYWLSDGNTVSNGYSPIEQGRGYMVFEDIPYGEYAISVYHDENDNKNLDTGLFGIPKEALGTSNNVKIRFGPPKYQDASFILDQSDLNLTIRLKKFF